MVRAFKWLKLEAPAEWTLWRNLSKYPYQKF